jgi:hypothetical protein
MALCAVLAGAAPALAATEPALTCTIETAANESTGEPVVFQNKTMVHALKDLRQDGDYYLGKQSLDDQDAHNEIAYRISRKTGRFEARYVQTRHDIGEEHVIRSTGTCTGLPR